MNNRHVLMGASLLLTLFVWQSMLGTMALAVGFIIMLAIHEAGHWLAAKQLGLPVSAPIFTPLGAMIIMPTLPKSAKEEAYIGIAGPVLGTVGAVAGFVLGVLLGVKDLVYVSQMAFMLNLFNLIPLAPLDGGRISMVISRHLWVLGAPLLAWVVWSSGFSPMTVLVSVLIGWQAFQDIAMRKQMAQFNPQYFQPTFAVRASYTAVYVGLAAFLAWAFFVPAQFAGLLINIFG
ncbi:MAG: site-2 protease family protein [Leptolyngbya sp.]|nr:site-2 protease family protein [Candidatus Melainabacteria bacterium]